MITFFNKLGNSWVAKIILGILALSMMAFWGLGGLSNIFSYNLNGDAVRVGDTGVSPEQIQQSFETTRKRISQMMGGQYLSPSKAIEMGLMDQVLQQEVAGAVQYQLGEDLGLTASNGAVQKYVENNPVFRDNTGKFDKNLFYAYLMQSGMDETGLARQLKKELAFKHLTDSVQGLGYAPQALAQAAYSFKNEKRDIDVLYLQPEQVSVAQKPSDQEIQDYYEAYTEEFMNPEYRTILVAALTPAMMAERVRIDEADIDAVYEEQKERYNQPEERELYQMFFKTAEEANQIKAKVTSQNFEKTATEEVGQTAKDTYFGFTAKNQLMEELADVVFKAKKGDIVGPIQSNVGWHILWVKEIKPAEITPEKTVKQEIRKTLALDKAYGALEDLARQLEDILGAGTDLATATKQLNIPSALVEQMDISGKLATGADMPAEYFNQELLQNIFILKKGDVSGLIQNNDGYLIAEVKEITPVAPKELKSVRDEIQDLWVKEQQTKLFPDIVKELTQKAKEGVDLNTLATQKGTFEVIQKKDMVRTNVMPELTNAVNTVFAQEAGVENAQSIPLESGVAIVIVRQIKKPDLAGEGSVIELEKEGTKQSVGTALNQETMQSYIQRIGVELNTSVIENIIKGYKGQD